MPVQERAISTYENRRTIERAMFLLNDAKGEKDMVFPRRARKLFELRRRDSDSGIIVFCKPLSTCE